jgi:hypothetical protein
VAGSDEPAVRAGGEPVGKVADEAGSSFLLSGEGGAHRGRLSAVARVGRMEAPVRGRRRGRRRRGCGR